MDIPRETREEFKKLSQEIFGASGKWKKFLDNGTTALLTRKTVETVPGENGAPDTQKEVDVPVLTANGTKQYYQKYYTVESLMEFLLELKKKRDDFMAMVKQQQEEAKAKKEAEALAKKVQEDLGGTALGGQV